jgi:hypothetical protein
MRAAASLEDERGVALVLALFALIVMSALVSTGFVAGRLEHESGRNTLFGSQAAEVAEAGLVDALLAISSGSLALPPAAGRSSLDTLNFASGFRVERQVSRLTSTLVLLRSTGTRVDADGGALAVRSVGLLLQLLPDPLGGPPEATPLGQRSWVQLH